jgi:hypothetical protein
MRALSRILSSAIVFASVAALTRGSVRPASAIEFERIVIDDNFPGAYQVEVADVNGDNRLDVVAVGGGTCAWYENPSWKKRLVTTPERTPGIISSATADLDGDGKAEIAIAYEFAMNEPTKGKLLLATQGKDIDDRWGVTPVADLGSIHRLRWGCLVGTPRVSPGSVRFERKLELVVAPLFGPSALPPKYDQEPAHLRVFDTGSDPKSGRWTETIVGDVPVLHAIDVTDQEGGVFSMVLGASNLGISRFLTIAAGGTPLFKSEILVPGAPGEAPKQGASEVHLGRFKDGRRFLATVEPWHGTDVAIYLAESPKAFNFGPRNVIDTSLKEGHALWVADLDGDGDDEIFAGFRGPGTSVLMYDFNGKTWDRAVVDPAIAAQDLRGGDLDRNGTPDIVAVGGKTHNVVWYKPRANMQSH